MNLLIVLVVIEKILRNYLNILIAMNLYSEFLEEPPLIHYFATSYDLINFNRRRTKPMILFTSGLEERCVNENHEIA